MAGVGGRGNEGSPALPSDDEAALAQEVHGVAEGLVRDSVLAGEIPLPGQLVSELAVVDAGGDGLGYLEVGRFRADEGVDLTHAVSGASVAIGVERVLDDRLAVGGR